MGDETMAPRELVDLANGIMAAGFDDEFDVPEHGMFFTEEEWAKFPPPSPRRATSACATRSCSRTASPSSCDALCDRTRQGIRAIVLTNSLAELVRPATAAAA